VNNCEPDCADGKFSYMPVAVALTNPQGTKTQGAVFATLTYTAADGTTASKSLMPDSSCSSFYKYC
jgi:hypothetical protein